MDITEWLILITKLLSDEAGHFSLAFFAGGSAFSLTWIIFSVSFLAWERLTRKQISTVVVYCTIILCMLAGSSAALLSHAWLDGFAIWYAAPLAPPLQLDFGGSSY